MATTPAHLAPENCYVCGGEPHEDTATAGHAFWSNADATKHFTQQRPLTHHYPGGETSPAAAYVAQHRPY